MNDLEKHVNIYDNFNFGHIIAKRKMLHKDVRWMLDLPSLARDISEYERGKNSPFTVIPPSTIREEWYRIPISINKKSADYWQGFEDGVIRGLETGRNYLVSSSINPEKVKKLAQFLTEEGISIMTSGIGGIVITDSKPFKEIVEYQFDYENER